VEDLSLLSLFAPVLLLFLMMCRIVVMATILHFRRQLSSPPDIAEVPGIKVQNFIVRDDVEPWLELRDRAMAEQVPLVRSWSKSDFQLEMLNKSWWSAERSWIAMEANGRECVVGAVTLALRKGATSSIPVAHWLLVDPNWQRRGIGRLLMSHLELAAWNDGWREIELETHAGWGAAVGFYQSIGYAPVRDRSPR
jgi:GNAT superfamily N-acetyltransferase